MSWQVLLTLWLLIQFVTQAANQPKLSALKGHNGAQLAGSIAGTVLRFVGMFACLYFGGFYS